MARNHARKLKRSGKLAQHPNIPAKPLEEPMPNVDPSDAGPKKVFVTCFYCGYTPAKVPSGGRCPKCGSSSWERYALSTRLLPEDLAV